MNILQFRCTAVRLRTEVGPINCELGNANIGTEGGYEIKPHHVDYINFYKYLGQILELLQWCLLL